MAFGYPVRGCIGFSEEHEPDGREESDDVVGYHFKKQGNRWVAISDILVLVYDPTISIQMTDRLFTQQTSCNNVLLLTLDHSFHQPSWQSIDPSMTFGLVSRKHNSLPT
jgi:hypothetical protein